MINFGVTRNSAVWITFITLISFWFLALIFDQRIMLEVASGLALGAAGTLTLQWLGSAIRAMRDGPSEGPGMLAMGLVGMGCSLMLQRFYANVLRWLDRPDWIVDSSFAAFIPWIMFTACVLMILAPGTKKNDVPTRNYVWFMFAAGVGIFIAGISVGYSLVHIAA